MAEGRQTRDLNPDRFLKNQSIMTTPLKTLVRIGILAVACCSIAQSGFAAAAVKQKVAVVISTLNNP